MNSSLVRETNAWLLLLSQELIADEIVFYEIFAWIIQLQYFEETRCIECDQSIEVWNILNQRTCMPNFRNQYLNDKPIVPVVVVCIISYFCAPEKRDSVFSEEEKDDESATISSRTVSSVLYFLRIVLNNDRDNYNTSSRATARVLFKKLWKFAIANNVCICDGDKEVLSSDRGNLLSLFQILSSTVNSTIKQLELSNNGDTHSSSGSRGGSSSGGGSNMIVDWMFVLCLDALLALVSLTTVEPFLPQISGLLRITAMVIKKAILLHNKSSDSLSIRLGDITSPMARIAESVEGNCKCKGAEEFMKGLATITMLIGSHRLSTVYSLRDSSSAASDVIIKDLKFLSTSLSVVHQYSRSLPVESSSVHFELKGYCDKMVKVIAKILLHIPSIIAVECGQLIANQLGDIVSGLVAASPMLLHNLQSQFISEVQELSAERLLDTAVPQLFKCFDFICSALFKVGAETHSELNYTDVMKMVTKCTIMISREHALDSREQHAEWKLSFMGLCDDLMALAVALDPDIVHRLPNSTATKLKGSTVDAKKKGNSKSSKASVSSNRHGINDSVLSRIDCIVHSLTCLRMWQQLSLCSSPYMGAHGFLSSTSSDSHCVFLSSAMKALEDLVAGLSDLGSARLGSEQSANIAFSLTETALRATIRQLYYLLDSQGRLPDQVIPFCYSIHRIALHYIILFDSLQVVLVRLVKMAARLCGDFGADIFVVAEELYVLLVIKMTLHGLPQDDVISDDGTTATIVSTRVNDFLKLSMSLLSWQESSPLVGAFDEKIQARAAYVQSASYLIDDLSTSPGPLGERWANQLQCWLTITCAKTLFIGLYDPVLSYQWAKRFFVCFSKVKTPPTSRHAKPGSKVLGGIPSHLSADLVPLVLEAVLLLAELHEHTGNVDSCLSYISEATALTKVHDRDTESCTVLTTYHNLVTLHAVRIWFRVSSPRFLSYLEETLIVEDQNRTSMKGDFLDL